MQTAIAPLPDALSIELQGIRRVFSGGVEALGPIDLKIEPGEFVAILGPSGCGKSTLLRLIAGLDSSTEGTISIQRRATDLAYVFQDAHLLPWRTVLGNVRLPLELIDENRSDRDSRAAEAIAHVGLTDAIHRYPAQLSGGMRMRVSLARALVTNPRLLLLDEPFAALDEITRQRLDEQLRQLWLQRRVTAVFVTHSTAEAVFLANRAIVLSPRPGQMVLDSPIDLPDQRTAELRGTPRFAGQTRIIYEALERGGRQP